MLDRLARPEIGRRLAVSPAVALLGPRQCGKTAFDLELQADRLRADLEWDTLARSREPGIFDEAQAWPDVFTRPARRGTTAAGPATWRRCWISCSA